MSFVIIIPARFASTRFPGKPLVKIAGTPMIEHVYKRAMQSGAAKVVVATDDQRIMDCVRSFGGEYIETRADHQSGSDRVYEAACSLGLTDDQIILNVQGDEPLISAKNISCIAKALSDNSWDMATLREAFTSFDAIKNPNQVKVVVDTQQAALYFSRSPIPFCAAQSNHAPEHWFRHVGIYGYRLKFLAQFNQWPVGNLENFESLEQLRALEQGARIWVGKAVDPSTPGVDTPEDVQTVEAWLQRHSV